MPRTPVATDPVARGPGATTPAAARGSPPAEAETGLTYGELY